MRQGKGSEQFSEEDKRNRQTLDQYEWLELQFQA